MLQEHSSQHDDEEHQKEPYSRNWPIYQYNSCHNTSITCCYNRSRRYAIHHNRNNNRQRNLYCHLYKITSSRLQQIQHHGYYLYSEDIPNCYLRITFIILRNNQLLHVVLQHANSACPN